MTPEPRNPTHPVLATRVRLAVLLAAILIVMFLVPLPFKLEHRRLFNHLSNAAHFPIFAIYAAVLYGFNIVGRHPQRIAWIGGLTAAAFELVQPLAGRTASWLDFGYGCLGVASTLSALWVWKTGRPAILRLVHAVVVLVVGSVVLQPAWSEWRAIRWRNQMFPVLGDFEAPQDLLLWRVHGGSPAAPARVELSDVFASSGRLSLRVLPGEGERAGLRYTAGSKNWSSFQELAFEIFNPGEPFQLTLRIDDGGDCSLPGSRYETPFEIRAGLNEIRVPLAEVRDGPRDRLLDLTDIRRASLYWPMDGPQHPYFLDAPRLR